MVLKLVLMYLNYHGNGSILLQILNRYWLLFVCCTVSLLLATASLLLFPVSLQQTGYKKVYVISTTSQIRAQENTKPDKIRGFFWSRKHFSWKPRGKIKAAHSLSHSCLK